jgi:hypothetical protein
MPDKTTRIRELNDQLRCEHRGGTIMITAGIEAMGADFITAVDVALTKVAFDPGNDPYGEHDFGSVDIKGKRVFFKIDYYDRDLCFASPDPSDEAVTRRVMTIMLAEEY